MSSSSVYQGLQSCLGPRVIEPRVLRLKLAPPSESESRHDENPLVNNECDTKTNTGGWSFLEALSNSSYSQCEESRVYVHPTVKRSSSVLSDKSLEMCTESLGSETGSNASESSDETCMFSFESNVNTSVVVPSRRVKRACSFPPPLTSITDFGGVHVRHHRKDGRLILEAVASPSPHPYFHAERSDGRLRIRLYESTLDDEEVDEECNHEGEGEDNDNGVDECVENVEGEMGVNMFGRPSRCKESGNRDFFGDGYFELPSLSLCL